MTRYWPLETGRIITSPFGPRSGGFHYGTDFGFPGGSAHRKVYAITDGTVLYTGAAQGYGGPDPAGWIVTQSPDNTVWEYGHIVRMPHIKPGVTVKAGDIIATINPNPATNGGTAPHLHLSYMPNGYQPGNKQDPIPALKGAFDPAKANQKDDMRPDFNEYPVWSRNNQLRGTTKPDLFLLHTQEGGTPKNGADNLARWLQGPVGVSYHYTISQDPDDGGVTVCDVVDTDRASWSVLSANARSINLCFAGSRAGWTRDEWMRQARAIDVAAYLAVQDCRKYGIPFTVIAPPYGAARAGISDHAYVTKVLKDGSHTDVGAQFPWDMFTASVNKYAGITQAPAKEYPRDFTDRQLLEDIWLKLDKALT